MNKKCKAHYMVNRRELARLRLGKAAAVSLNALLLAIESARLAATATAAAIRAATVAARPATDNRRQWQCRQIAPRIVQCRRALLFGRSIFVCAERRNRSLRLRIHDAAGLTVAHERRWVILILIFAHAGERGVPLKLGHRFRARDCLAARLLFLRPSRRQLLLLRCIQIML